MNFHRSRLGLIFVIAASSLFGQRDNAPALANQPPVPLPLPNLAQAITDRALARHPDILVVAFHAVVPGDKINRVVAINRTLWQKFQWRPSDEIDTDTSVSSRTVVQVIPATHRMEVHMPLHNKDGATVATFVTVFNFKDEEEAPELIRRSQKLRDEIAPEITTVDRLLAASAD
jgi:hypothetical protein